MLWNVGEEFASKYNDASLQSFSSLMALKFLAFLIEDYNEWKHHQRIIIEWDFRRVTEWRFRREATMKNKDVRGAKDT